MKELGAEIVDPIIIDPQSWTMFGNIADYRFKDDWEKYLATFGPRVPKTVAEFLRSTKRKLRCRRCPRPKNVLDLLERALATSTDLPAYSDLIEAHPPGEYRD